MKINKGLLLVAVVLGLMTAFGLHFYLGSVSDPARADSPRSEVVVAKTTIPAHTRISEDMLEVSSLPEELVHGEAVRDPAEAANSVARTEIVGGEQVLRSRLSSEDRGSTLSYRVPENMRAVSIPVDEVTGVAGYVTPGDKVDVLVTYANGDEVDEDDEDAGPGDATRTYTVLQRVEVLAVGELPREVEDDESRLVNTVTVKVNPEQAEVLAYSHLSGSFHLSLRSPVDEEEVKLEAFGSTNFNDFRER